MFRHSHVKVLNTAGVYVNRHVQYTKETPCFSVLKRHLFLLIVALTSLVYRCKIVQCTEVWTKIHKSTKCDWQVITSRAKSCNCVNPKCDWLFWQVHLFCTVSRRFQNSSGCVMDNKTLLCYTLQHKLHFSVFFPHESMCHFSYVTPCEVTAPLSASAWVKNNVCRTTMLMGKQQYRTTQTYSTHIIEI